MQCAAARARSRRLRHGAARAPRPGPLAPRAAAQQAADGGARERERQGVPVPGEASGEMAAPASSPHCCAVHLPRGRIDRCCRQGGVRPQGQPTGAAGSPAGAALRPRHAHPPSVPPVGFPVSVTSMPRPPPVLQVFEYLTTDLKRYMDRNGKGPAYPLPTPTVKVRVGAAVGAVALQAGTRAAPRGPAAPAEASADHLRARRQLVTLEHSPWMARPTLHPSPWCTS